MSFDGVKCSVKSVLYTIQDAALRLHTVRVIPIQNGHEKRHYVIYMGYSGLDISTLAEHQ